MNREIKFRVWHPFYGMMEPQDIFKMTSFRYDNGDGSKTLEKYYEPDVTFLQFTGLKDSKGKEIYEGDIIESVSQKFDGMKSKGKIVWKDFAWYWQGDFGFVALIRPERLEVIGNIYENPKLLTPNP